MASCANATAHRKAQAKYVSKNRAAQRKRADAYYKKNATQIKATKKAARKAGTAGSHGHTLGRPRTCS